ncbi:hypothetical protein Pint_29675 [Pistacia integerrima]|uniref:Uncharacterized protein n=1 Tax=Pistacia integerrima TaxID=434235 RepID=A0ACC0WZQ3_9ROSI|nr:hypothetical protein Pint_29675 [Pistacia integerrima]
MELMSTKDLLEVPSFEKPEIQDDKPLEPVSLTEAKDLCDLEEIKAENHVRVSGLVLTRHWLRKLKWRPEKGKRRKATATIQGKAQSQHDRTNVAGAIYSESTILDVDSSTSLGYHAY